MDVLRRYGSGDADAPVGGLVGGGCAPRIWLERGRAFDVDDFLLNTLGVLCGYGLARLLGQLAPGFVQRFRPQSDLHEK